MKPTFKTRMMAMLPSNKYKFAPYSVQVFQHKGRTMTPQETDFISSVQRLPLEGVAQVLCKYSDNPQKIELVRIGMLFHIYRNDFIGYLKKNKAEPKVRTALEVWQGVATLEA
jgi:hypothetical protein